MSSIIKTAAEEILRDFRPLRSNLFEAVLLRSSGVDIRRTTGSGQGGSTAGSFMASRQPTPGVKTIPRKEDPFFLRFLIEEMNFETGSIEVQEHPIKRSLFIKNATPPRRLTLSVRESVDLQIFRVFRDIFVSMYNPFTGLYGGFVPLTLFVGTYDVLESEVPVGRNSREKTDMVLTNVFAFKDCFLLTFPTLTFKWNEKGFVTHTLNLAFSIMDFVSLKTLVQEIDSSGSGESRIKTLEDFIKNENYGGDFIKNGSFTRAAEHSARAREKVWEPVPVTERTTDTEAETDRNRTTGGED